jgi:hypothetical protein
MSKLFITLALACFVASAAYAEDTTATAKQSAAPAAAVSTSGSADSKMPSRALEAYKAAGLSDEQIEKLKALQDKVKEARSKGEKVDFKAMKDERDKIFTPEQNEKYQAYLKEHMKATMMAPKAADKPADKPAETK